MALVTGGNSGIGLGMAEGLAAQGAAVAIWGTNPAKNDAAVERLAELGGDVHAVVCDVGDRDAVVASMAETVGELGRVDSCFVNAGVGGAAPSFLEMTADEWRRVLRVNLDGAFYTAQEATRHMVERFADGDTAGGSLVFTTSGSAYFGQQKGQHYGASKAGLIAMMRGIAVEHARHGIRANAVLPGWIESDMTAGRVDVGPLRRAQPAAGPDAPLGRPQRLRRHRRLPRRPGQPLHHRRRDHDRRRLPQLLLAGWAARSLSRSFEDRLPRLSARL